MRTIDLSANLRGADLSKANFTYLFGACKICGATPSIEYGWYHYDGCIYKGEIAQPVIFRVLTHDPQKGQVIALFPFMPEHNGLVNSYMHVGQHGAADYAGMIRQSRKATPEEYMPLYRELTQAPYYYNLIVYDRKPRS